MWLELLLVLALTLVNGVLAMSVLAIVLSRTARLRVLAGNGSRGAAIAMRLAADPGRFLSSVQIGITLVGVLSGAFSGARLGVRLAGALSEARLGTALAQTLGVGGAVVAITYVSLIFGELVPKQIVLRAPEGGLQLTARLPEVADDGPLRASLNDAGFAVSSLSDYFLDAPVQGLVIGFGTANARDARRFAETLLRLLDSGDGG